MEGHTVGLHSYTHEYDQVYASVDAYFDDLEKIGEVDKRTAWICSMLYPFSGRRIEFYFKKILGRNYDTADTAGVG